MLTHAFIFLVLVHLARLGFSLHDVPFPVLCALFHELSYMELI